MSSWIFFALAAPTLYAISNFFDKFLVDKKVKDLTVLPVFSGGIAFLIGISIFVLRGFPLFPVTQTAIILISGAISTAALLPYYKAISLEDPSRVIPFYELRPLLVLLLSYALLSETLAGRQLIGFAFAFVGGLLLAIEKLEGGMFRLRKAVGYALLGTLMFAFPSVLFKYVVIQQSFADSLAYEFIGSGIGAFLLVILFRRIRTSGTSEAKSATWDLWATLTANEVVYATGLACGFYAVKLGSPSLVAVVGGIQPFVVLLFGSMLSVWFPSVVKEDIRPATIAVKLLGSAFIFIGIWFAK